MVLSHVKYYFYIHYITRKVCSSKMKYRRKEKSRNLFFESSIKFKISYRPNKANIYRIKVKINRIIIIIFLYSPQLSYNLPIKCLVSLCKVFFTGKSSRNR